MNRVNNEGIRKYFVYFEVWGVDSLPLEWDGVQLAIHATNEPDYMILLMTTYGTLERVIEKMQRTYHEKVANRQKTFLYPEELLKHFNDCDSVDSHNSSLMDPISLEETRNTTRWPVRVFMFLLDTTEANCQLATENIYDHPACFQQEFRR